MKNLLVILCLLALLCLSACCPPPVSAGTNTITQFYAPTEPDSEMPPIESLSASPPLQYMRDFIA